VRIVGDLERLVETDGPTPDFGPATDERDPDEVMVPPEVAGRAAVGVLLASGLAGGATRGDAGDGTDGSPSDGATDGAEDLVMAQIGGVLVRRLEAAARRPVDRVVRTFQAGRSRRS